MVHLQNFSFSVSQNFQKKIKMCGSPLSRDDIVSLKKKKKGVNKLGHRWRWITWSCDVKELGVQIVHYFGRDWVEDYFSFCSQIFRCSKS